MNKKVRILSLDGGGIRGVIPAIVLRYVEAQLQAITKNPHARIADFFDLIVGTSTGGILTALYLTPNPTPSPTGPVSKFSAAEVVQAYEDNAHTIFEGARRVGTKSFKRIFNATLFHSDPLQKVTRKLYGDTKLSDMLKVGVLTTYNLVTQNLLRLTNLPADLVKRDLYLRDAVISTGAAPTYYPPATVKNLLDPNERLVNVDGGVGVNNPSVYAYAIARQHTFPQQDFPKAADMLVLSIGNNVDSATFNTPSVHTCKTWGLLKWASVLMKVFMDSNVAATHQEMSSIFSSLDQHVRRNYKRISVPEEWLDKFSQDFTDSSKENIKNLQKAGEATIQAANQDTPESHSLDEFIQLLVDNG